MKEIKLTQGQVAFVDDEDLERLNQFKMTIIGYNNKMIYLGLFKLLEDADKAYRDAEVKYFGSFARNERGRTIQC